MHTRKVIVVGGGTAGLSAAYTLKKLGIRAIVLEANERLGGRLGGDRVDGFHLDEGTDFFTSSHNIAIGLSEELGLRFIPLTGGESGLVQEGPLHRHDAQGVFYRPRIQESPGVLAPGVLVATRGLVGHEAGQGYQRSAGSLEFRQRFAACRD